MASRLLCYWGKVDLDRYKRTVLTYLMKARSGMQVFERPQAKHAEGEDGVCQYVSVSFGVCIFDVCLNDLPSFAPRHRFLWAGHLRSLTPPSRRNRAAHVFSPLGQSGPKTTSRSRFGYRSGPASADEYPRPPNYQICLVLQVPGEDLGVEHQNEPGRLFECHLSFFGLPGF